MPFGPADHWVDGNGVTTDIRYDQDYRITSIDVHGTNNNSDILSLGYTYNANSDITAMADKLGIDSQQFGYDALNRLTSATDDSGTTQPTFQHVTTDNKPVTQHLQFVYDENGNLISESDGEGNVVREYIYLGNYRIAMTASSLDHPEVTPSVVSTGAAAGGGAERPQSSTLSLYFIHNDHLGTPRDVTDANRNIVWAMHQTPFGETALDTEAISMPMRFPGQYADIESGLNYNYFRDDARCANRRAQSKPILEQILAWAERQDVNPYAYLKLVFTRLPDTPADRIDSLLPWQIPAAELERQILPLGTTR